MSRYLVVQVIDFSPRARGSTLTEQVSRVRVKFLPASAGINPARA